MVLHLHEGVDRAHLHPHAAAVVASRGVAHSEVGVGYLDLEAIFERGHPHARMGVHHAVRNRIVLHNDFKRRIIELPRRALDRRLRRRHNALDERLIVRAQPDHVLAVRLAVRLPLRLGGEAD